MVPGGQVTTLVWVSIPWCVASKNIIVEGGSKYTLVLVGGGGKTF